jgi:hypothetical protein
MLTFDALRSMNVMFATPCYASSVTSPYMASMYSLAGDCANYRLKNRLELHSESLITRGRNKLVEKFLGDETLTHLFWIDADLLFMTEAVFRLLLADHDVCAGVYPLKQFNWPAGGIPQHMDKREFEDRYNLFPFCPIENRADDDGFCEVVAVTTGFMCIKRDVFIKLMHYYPKLNYVPDGPPNNPRAHLTWRFFDCIIDNGGRYLSEDYSFCKLWRDLGGKIYADVHSKLDHLGQHLFHGDLMATLQAKSADVVEIAQCR